MQFFYYLFNNTENFNILAIQKSLPRENIPLNQFHHNIYSHKLF